jgi:hypothetical protein
VGKHESIDALTSITNAPCKAQHGRGMELRSRVPSERRFLSLLSLSAVEEILKGRE